MAGRLVQPELLDALAADDPRAVRSRRDLARVNGWMGTSRIFARLLARHLPAAPARWLDIGTGDGRLVLRLARRLAPAWPAGQGALLLADRQPIVPGVVQAGLSGLGWRVECLTGDVFALLDQTAPVDLVTANLFLHHFDPPALADLLARVGRVARAMVFVEPRRGWVGAAGARLMWLIGGNGVTRHDARVSVQAGFAGNELETALPAGWQVLREGRAGLFSHVLVARRVRDDAERV